MLDNGLNRRSGYPEYGRPAMEWPTLILILMTYLGIALITLHFQQMPWTSGFSLVLLLAFHTSLVHEIIHGHPTRSNRFNDLLGSPPLTLIYPYPVFKRSHLAHHCDAHLTLPDIDPESFYLSARRWHQMGRVRRFLAWCNMTLLGRMLLNPVISFSRMARACGHALLTGPDSERRIWLWHILFCSLVLFLIATLTTTPILIYLGCVYLSHSLISLRSFFEHRAIEIIDHRIVVVEGCRFFKLLFLNNNFHAIHHRYPWLPWYSVESVYRREVGVALERNGAFHVAGYARWLKYILRPIASPVHPFSD